MVIAFVKYDKDNKEHCFYAPQEIEDYIKEGLSVIVKDKSELKIAEVASIITGNDVVDIAIHNGADLPLEPILSIVETAIKERL